MADGPQALKNDTVVADTGTADEERIDAHEVWLVDSVGYQLRMANRATQRHLQTLIEPHGVALGMWYFLRALWQEDGLTQRELSEKVGTMEPTTLHAIAGMERAGIVERRRNTEDRRKINIYLTEKGNALRQQLLPIARDVVNQATKGFSERERKTFVANLMRVRRNFDDETLDT